MDTYDKVKEFTCPECGSNYFGTSDCHKPTVEQTGHCHDRYQTGCTFTWSREDDHKYFKEYNYFKST